MTAPTDTPTGALEQAVIPAVPSTPQLILLAALLGAVAPVVPVTVAVKVRVEPKAPPPLSVRTTVGVTWAMRTVVGAVAARAM